ncbi:unnamed protein product [Notodromas monacha]|uniref:BCL-11A-like CCHC zinc finger domain-containing protein n=1 Tax=Notodromas monacha TaxID=399045 RepID=A0A7R9BDP8_9CRUS|nr:unnamed protein product [Notodromas monacha]CAG0913423.1 unnamed protein product [Notodromas monacha]
MRLADSVDEAILTRVIKERWSRRGMCSALRARKKQSNEMNGERVSRKTSLLIPHRGEMTLMKQRPEDAKNARRDRAEPPVLPTPDMLTCGVCSKEFVLEDIVKFIQHKVNSCNKENYVQCSERDEDADGGSRKSDGVEADNGNADDAEPVSTDVVRRTPSISAPLAGRRPRPTPAANHASSPDQSALRKHLSSTKRRRDDDSADESADADDAASKDMRLSPLTAFRGSSAESSDHRPGNVIIWFSNGPESTDANNDVKRAEYRVWFPWRNELCSSPLKDPAENTVETLAILLGQGCSSLLFSHDRKLVICTRQTFYSWPH